MITTGELITLGGVVIAATALGWQMYRGRIKLENRIATVEEKAKTGDKRMERIEDKLLGTVLAMVQEIAGRGGSS